jgi:ribonucleoside-diphosphate reductase alpha chain
MNITVVKRNGEREPYDANKINLAIEHAAEGLEDSIAWVTQIASELELTLFDGITTQQLDEAVIQVALQNVKDDPAFDVVAARLLVKTIYKRCWATTRPPKSSRSSTFSTSKKTSVAAWKKASWTSASPNV